MGIARRVVSNGARVVRRVAAGQIVSARSGNWLDVHLDGPVPDVTHDGFGKPALGLLDLLRCLDAVGEDPRFAGVLLRMRGGFASFGRALSLARAIRELREKGRRVVVWADGLAADGYLLAAAADRVWLPESGTLHLIGIRSERFFLRDLLDRIGARPDVVHIGRFKSAGEMFTRDAMSDEEREQLEAWQDDLFAELVSGIAEGRGLSTEEVEQRIDGGPYPAAAAVEAGLIDAMVYPDELEDRLTGLAMTADPPPDAARAVHLVAAVPYAMAIAVDAGFEPLWRDAPRLVQLVAAGNVSRGGGQRGITTEGTGALLESLRREPSVRGVLLRVESPGGDALASDLLHRQIERLVREKPVVVSMGDVVASGGYYISAPADAIYVEAGAVTGSIGVVGGKLDLSGLYEKLGVSKDGVQRGARAGITSESRGFTADERAAVRREMEAIYGTFVDRVARGRALGHGEVREIAEGRIWSGRRAHSVGLVDFLGGPLEALRDLAGRAGLRAGESFHLVTLPRPSRLSELIGGLLSGGGPFGRLRG